jgi:hypothetical protein
VNRATEFQVVGHGTELGAALAVSARTAEFPWSVRLDFVERSWVSSKEIAVAARHD